MPPHPLLLLVEGIDDKFVIAELFEQATGEKWEAVKGRRLVDIESCGSDGELLQRVGVKWKESGRRVLGIVIDADSSPGARWQSVRSSAPVEVRPLIPDQPPSNGFVVDVGDEGRRFGVWLMPDNQSTGMLETFLKHLRPDSDPSLLSHVDESMRKARELGAPWKETHSDKAEIHTWLAWQDPPGQQLHSAIMQRMLNPQSDLARPFIDWFRSLYRV